MATVPSIKMVMTGEWFIIGSPTLLGMIIDEYGGTPK
jgi:hypothetical protein